jgi:hypothetical protein
VKECEEKGEGRRELEKGEERRECEKGVEKERR